MRDLEATKRPSFERKMGSPLGNETTPVKTAAAPDFSTLSDYVSTGRARPLLPSKFSN